MKKPSQSPHVSPQTPLASGMGLASTAAADLLVLLQNQTQYIQSLETNLNQLTVENARLKSLEIENERLKHALLHHQRMRFGTKSEAFNTPQQDLFAEDWAADEADLQQQLEHVTEHTQTTPKAKRPRAGRQALPAHLTRIDVRHEPASCTCGDCGRALTLIRDEVVEKLDVIPAQFHVMRHIYPQMACRACETIVAAPSEASVIQGGLASARLLAWIIVSKFADHLPLYRLEQIAARQQVPLPRSTLSSWVGLVGYALGELVERLVKMLLQRAVLHADETPVQQLDPKAKLSGTKKAYLWAYRSNSLDSQDPIVVFDYQGNREGRHVRAFLGDWQGHLVVDDYGGYKALFEATNTEGKRLRTEVGCWAHIRRKFFEVHVKTKHPIAAEALRRIQCLYAIEREAQEQNLSTVQRQALRVEKSVPILLAFEVWLKEQTHCVAPSSGLAQALAHALKRWPSLVVYAQTGDVPIDNNPVENSIRPIAVGKKNWLFAGSERAGQRAAAIQGLLATAKLNGLEPLAWLTDTLEKLPTWPKSRLDELLPLRSMAKKG